MNMETNDKEKEYSLKENKDFKDLKYIAIKKANIYKTNKEEDCNG